MTSANVACKTPRVLTLHLNRSVHFGYHASKNTCRVKFPEILDLSPFATSGRLSTKPDLPISSPHQLHQLAPSTPGQTLYQLSAVVCHYGQHSFGHYICYRRKPRPVSAGAARFSPPELFCPLECRCEQCIRSGPFRAGKRELGCGWLRISDDSVKEVDFETVATESSSAFMLFYERVLQPRKSSALQQVVRGSEETVRPKDVQPKKPEPVQDDTRSQSEDSSPRTNGVQPRIVRNVSARRTESPVPQPKQKSSGSKVSTSSLMRGGSYFNEQAQQSKSQPNGHVRMPATTSGSWYRSAPSPPPTIRESRPPASNASPHLNSPSRSQSRVPAPSTTRIHYQPQQLET